MRIREPDLVQRILKTILPARGDESQVPVELDESQVLAVLDLGRFLPTTEQTGVSGPIQISDQPGAISAAELWAHSGQRTSGAGGAGQFSSVGDAYQSIAAAEAVTRLQIVELRLRASIDAQLILFHVTTDFSQAEGDLANLETNLRSVSDASASNFGFVDFLQQTATPLTTGIGAGYSAEAKRAVAHLLANQDYLFPLGPVAFYNRLVGPAQTQAFGWQVSGLAAVTAITVTYSLIIRKLPA